MQKKEKKKKKKKKIKKTFWTPTLLILPGNLSLTRGVVSSITYDNNNSFILYKNKSF